MAEFELSEPIKPVWTMELPRISYPLELLTANRSRVSERSDGLLAYHPLVVGNRVIVQVGQQRDQILVGLKTGELLLPPATREKESSDVGRGILGVPRFTNSSMGDHLFVRIDGNRRIFKQ